VEPKELFAIVRSSMERQPSIAPNWAQLERDFLSRLRPATGRAKAPAGPAQTQAVIALPSRRPDWVGQEIDVQGTAASVGDRLRTRAAAEADAMNRLRSRLEVLALNGSGTLGEVAKADRRLGEAFSRALRRAQVDKTEFRADGSVVVQMTIDTDDVWEELQR
jgi:hypothetical protein